MTYDRQILRILSDVGEQGISVQLLAKHVFNQKYLYSLRQIWMKSVRMSSSIC